MLDAMWRMVALYINPVAQIKCRMIAYKDQELLVAIVTSMVHFTMSVTRSMIFLLANQIVTSLVRPKCGMTLVAQIIQIIIKQQKSY